MEVGEYVRTKHFGINKIKGFYSDVHYDYIMVDDDLIKKEDIIKSSPNIIDLIEENDLITIEYYSLRYSERVTRLFEATYKDDEYIVLDNAKCSFMLKNNDFNRKDKQLEPIIKSIVTKEQFESMEYKVGE